MIIELDIWGNITKFKNKGFWVKQKYMNNLLLEYEDSDGNHWIPEYLIDNPFVEYKLNLEYGYVLNMSFLKNYFKIRYSVNNINFIIHDFEKILWCELSHNLTKEIDGQILKELEKML